LPLVYPTKIPYGYGYGNSIYKNKENVSLAPLLFVLLWLFGFSFSLAPMAFSILCSFRLGLIVLSSLWTYQMYLLFFIFCVQLTTCDAAHVPLTYEVHWKKDQSLTKLLILGVLI